MPRSQVAQNAAASHDLEAGDEHAAGATAVTIGNFDGVHRGHAALIRAARVAVGERGRIVAMAFDPNPLVVLRPEAAPPRLTTFEQRSRSLRQLGVDEVARLEPTREFLQQDAPTFISTLVERWQPACIVEGADFRFGRGRAGSIETLRQLEPRFGYRTVVVDPVEVALCDQSIVRASSSLARWLVSHGRVRDAMIALGRPFEIEARVVAGDRRGRDLGFPTANLQTADDQLMPADGIYTGVARREGHRDWLTAISVGTKPTFGGNARVCEAYMLDCDGPLDDYGWTIRLQFKHWLRDQLTFPNAAALIERLHNDIAAVRRLHREVPGIGMPGLWERQDFSAA